MIKHNLVKIQENYFEAGVENAKIGNEIILNFKNQIFSAINLYLIFTATLFFFLAAELNNRVWYVPIKVWVGAGIISGSLSLVVGLIALKSEHGHVISVRRIFLTKAQKLIEYIRKNKVNEIEEIPEELEGIIEDKDIICRSSKVSDILTITQFILFGISLTVDIIAVVGAII